MDIIQENFIEATENETAVPNPIHFQEKQFRYESTIDRTIEVAMYNSTK